MWFYATVMSLVINTINIPFDNGANKIGSRNSPKVLTKYLDFLNISKTYDIETNNFITNILSDGYNAVFKTLSDGKVPVVLGGDHTVAISSVFASNDYCNLCNKKLGVVWCDAHADFNTIETSITKNIHGMPIAVLCGHTLESLVMGKILDTDQFGYYGVRDVDSLELLRMQEYDMKIFDNVDDIDNWIKQFDYIHVSFDIDCLDPSVTNCVNTPVPNGITKEQLKEVFRKIKKSRKLCALDIVEYNSDKGDDHSIVVDIVKELF